MNLEEFIKKYIGKFVEYHSYGSGALNQCVDLANQYIVEVLGKQAIIGTNAVDFPARASKDDYDWIPDAPMTVPQKGDLVIWKTNHIAICIYADVQLPWFTSFDQNWPTGSACIKVDHSYSNISGWLRPKGGSMNQICLDSSTFEKLVSKSSKYDEFKKGGFENIGEVNNLIENLREDVKRNTEAKKIAEEKAEDYRKEFNNLLATLASEDYFNTTQEMAQVLAEAKKASQNVKELEDLQRNFVAYKDTAAKTESNLRAEIARLKALLAIEKEDLIKEMLRNWINKLKEILEKIKRR